MTEEKTVRVRKKHKSGTHTHPNADGTLRTFRGGDIWEDCPIEIVDNLHPEKWEFLDPKEEQARGGRSRRAPVKPIVGLSAVPCPDQEGMFDVVNDTTDKRINDDPLTEDEANQLIADTGDTKGAE